MESGFYTFKTYNFGVAISLLKQCLDYFKMYIELYNSSAYFLRYTNNMEDFFYIILLEKLDSTNIVSYTNFILVSTGNIKIRLYPNNPDHEYVRKKF